MLEHRILYDEAAIATRVSELAAALRRDAPDVALVVIGLLTGGVVFAADLIRALARLGVEPQVDFMAVSHYGLAVETSGAARIQYDAQLDVNGRTVLIVDDILDTGRTMQLVRNHLSARGPKWLRTCAFLDKPSRRVVEIEADYVGFVVPDVWIIGYGLDAGGQGRALPYVAAVDKQSRKPPP